MNKLKFLFLFSLLAVNNTQAQFDSLMKHSTYAGINIFRIASGDIEFQLTHQIIKQLSVGFAAGYDFNFTENFVTHPSTANFDSTKRMESVEESSNPRGRYFDGKGAAYRFYIDYDFVISKKMQWFVSAEGMCKNRNYSMKPFADRDYYRIYKESGKQTIAGGSIYAGFNCSPGGRFILRTYMGIGVRVLNSSIQRPGWHDGSTYHQPVEFAYQMVMPALHLGCAIMFRL